MLDERRSMSNASDRVARSSERTRELACSDHSTLVDSQILKFSDSQIFGALSRLGLSPLDRPCLRLVLSASCQKRSEARNSRAATRSRRDGALDAALERLAPAGPLARPDTPDLHVTAVRRLPAVAPSTRRFRPRSTRGCARRSRRAAFRSSTRIRPKPSTHALAGRNVVVITPTASGKTLCYNAPVLNAILQDPSSRALYLFPTKALAQDQLAELQGLCETLEREAPATEIGVFTYDGDTPQDARRTIRARAHLVLSNPDMVHSGILPHHPRWAKLFENLRYVVIDELHAYRGVFGSHLCNVLRRLRRICRHYGSDPVFLCSSATIANPRELAERLTEQPFELVEQSGAPRGEKFFVFVNPPVVNHQLGIRRVVSRRDAADRVGVPEAEPAAHRVRAEPAVDRDPDDVPEGRLRGRAGSAGADSRLSRRLSADRRREIEKGLREGASGRSCRPTRSSSASTSARSTCR